MSLPLLADAKITTTFFALDNLVFAAFFAAADLFCGPFVLTALRAAAERSEAVRFIALRCAWRDNASLDTDPLRSFFNARTFPGNGLML